MRNCLSRNEHGQFDDDRYAEIGRKAYDLCKEYFNEFSDVDFNDLYTILITEGNWAKTCTMASEVK